MTQTTRMTEEMWSTYKKARKEEMVRKFWIRNEQKATGVSKEKVQRQPLRTIWSTILVKTTYVSRQNGRVP